MRLLTTDENATTHYFLIFTLKFTSKVFIFLHLDHLLSVNIGSFSEKTAVKTKIHIISLKIFWELVEQMQDVTRDIFRTLSNNYTFCVNIWQVLVSIALLLKK